MRKLLLAAAAAAASVAMPNVANAASCITATCSFTPGDPEFDTSGDTTFPITGGVSASIGRTNIPVGLFTDTYFFIVDVDGKGSGSFSTSLSGDGSVTDATNIDFLSAFINGQIVPITGSGTDIEFAGLTGVSIMAGVVNELVITGRSYGALGSYGGNLTFTPNAVPEPATWALMLMGFGAIGYGMRRNRNTQVSFA